MSTQNTNKETKTKILGHIENWTDLIGNLFVALFHRVTLLELERPQSGLQQKPST